MRVGGGAGIGVKYLAREDSHVVGMLGSGGMARTFLRSVQVRARHPPVQGLQPDAASIAKHLPRKCRKPLNIEVRAVDDPREAVRGADILSSVHRQHAAGL